MTALDSYSSDEQISAALAGRSIKAVFINGQKDLIRIDFNDGPAIYISANGGCCSRSWFEHFDSGYGFAGAKITGVKRVEMPGNLELDGFFDKRKWYGLIIKTGDSEIRLEMRNESNGYYGGDFVFGEKPIGQYSEERKDQEELVFSEVTEDF